MKLQFTYRHVDISPSLNTYAQEQFERVGRLLKKDSRWQIFFSMGRYDYHVEVNVHGGWGYFKASATAEDFYEAVDEVAAKLERQIHKKKEQHQHHKKSELSRAGQMSYVSETMEYFFHAKGSRKPA
ncbi:MAG: ribosome-associated translation inhibitor RaiA [Bdellovibrio sp.]|nr:MAG: ribosome-associated translation inhibitor RaiA [Bdellovibrio sp.]